MRKRDGKESDRDGGKIACEYSGDVWIRFGRSPRAEYSHGRCPQLSGASVIFVGSGVGYESTLPLNTHSEISTYVAMMYLWTPSVLLHECRWIRDANLVGAFVPH